MIDTLGFYERVAIGTGIEQQIVECLNRNYGYRLEKSSFEEDTEQKIDFIERGTRTIKAQIKSRESGSDLLYDLYEPWRGSIEESDIGRDQKSNFDIYICLSKDKQWIRIALGKAMKNIINTAHEEWLTQGCQFPNKTRNGKTYWNSKQFSGLQFWLHRDAKNRRLKVLAFIPESLFDSKSFKRYRMV